MYAGGGKRQGGSKGWEFYTGLAATGNTAISTFGYHKQYTQFSKVLEIWKGNNGIIYQGLKGRGPNGFTGSRAAAAAKSAKIGVGTNALTVIGIGITAKTHNLEMKTNPGPNLKRYYETRYIRDQAFNASGFFTIWGAATSTGYNLGYLIEFLTGKNIQLNPYTHDFTPIEETLTEFDNLGLYHVYK